MAREYEEVQRLAAQVNATHNPELTRRMLQTSHEMVSFTNSVATGRVSSSYNSYSAYDSNGNATSYYNSSYDTGYIPSPNAPRIKDVEAERLEFCEKEKENKDKTPTLTQQALEKLKQVDWGRMGMSSAVAVQALPMTQEMAIGLSASIAEFENAARMYMQALGESATQVKEGLAILLTASALDGPLPIVDIVAAIAGATIVVVGAHEIYKVYKDSTQTTSQIDLEQQEKPPVVADPLPEQRKPQTESLPREEEEKGSNLLPEPKPEESPGLQTTAPMVPDEQTNIIWTAETPDYVKYNRVPTDKETVLAGEDYKKTNILNQGAKVYEKDGYYFCRDNSHAGYSAHLEVFDKFGNHIGEADPQTGEIDRSKADPKKHLKK